MNPASSPPDILSVLVEALIQTGGRLDNRHLSFIILADILLGFPTVICFAYFVVAGPRRHQWILWILFPTFFLLAALIPVPRITAAITNPAARTFILILGIVAALLLPKAASFVLVKQAQNQRRVARAIYWILFTLTFLNFFVFGGHR